MGVAIRDAGNVSRKAVGFKMRDAGGTLRTIVKGQIRDAGGTLRVFWTGDLIVNTGSGEVHAVMYTNTFTSKTVNSGPQGVNSVIGGTAPYTYAWTLVGGDTITCSNAAIDKPAWSASVPYHESKQASWKCTVTDSLGNKGTAFLTIILELVYYGTEPLP